MKSNTPQSSSKKKLIDLPNDQNPKQMLLQAFSLLANENTELTKSIEEL